MTAPNNSTLLSEASRELLRDREIKIREMIAAWKTFRPNWFQFETVIKEVGDVIGDIAIVEFKRCAQTLPELEFTDEVNRLAQDVLPRAAGRFFARVTANPEFGPDRIVGGDGPSFSFVSERDESADRAERVARRVVAPIADAVILMRLNGEIETNASAVTPSEVEEPELADAPAKTTEGVEPADAPQMTLTDFDDILFDHVHRASIGEIDGPRAFPTKQAFFRSIRERRLTSSTYTKFLQGKLSPTYQKLIKRAIFNLP